MNVVMNIPCCVTSDIDLAQYNWFGVGGRARYFAVPRDEKEFQAVISFSRTMGLLIKVIGLGANILISDHGFDGVIVKLPDDTLEYEYKDEKEGFLTIGAGVSLEKAIFYSLNEALLFGLEEFSGIPSSIGGAVFINLHYYEFLIERFVYSALVYHSETNTISTVDREWFEFGYDLSKIKKESRYIVLQVTFLLKRGDALQGAFAKGRSIEIIRHRQNRYPYQRTCGCFFKNFSKEDIPFEIEGKKIGAASYYLDRAGARNNLRINHCFVSSQHANMITHDGQGNATDIIALARLMQKMVYEKFQLLLEPECELIGFSSYPLYTKETIAG